MKYVLLHFVIEFPQLSQNKRWEMFFLFTPSNFHNTFYTIPTIDLLETQNFRFEEPRIAVFIWNTVLHTSNCNCLINVFFYLSRGNSLRVRPGVGRRDGEPLGERATSGRWISRSIGRRENRRRRYATCLGKFATAGRGGRGFSSRPGRGAAAAAVEAHPRGELPPKAAIKEGELTPPPPGRHEFSLFTQKEKLDSN